MIVNKPLFAFCSGMISNGVVNPFTESLSKLRNLTSLTLNFHCYKSIMIYYRYQLFLNIVFVILPIMDLKELV